MASTKCFSQITKNKRGNKVEILEARSVYPNTVYVLLFAANLVLDCVRLSSWAEKKLKYMPRFVFDNYDRVRVGGYMCGAIALLLYTFCDGKGVNVCLDIGIGIFVGIGAFQIGYMRKLYKKTLDIADNVLQKTGIGKSIDDYDFERLMHLDSCMRVHLKGHDDYELKLVANPALSIEQMKTLTTILKLGGLTQDEMTYVADPYNSPKAMEYISSAICSGLPLKDAVIVAEILNFRPDELEK